MPFGRRKKKQTYFYLKGFIKNALSFSRTKKYISLSMKRMRGSPQELSIGLATGLAVSFTPFIGFKLVSPDINVVSNPLSLNAFAIA